MSVSPSPSKVQRDEAAWSGKFMRRLELSDHELMMVVSPKLPIRLLDFSVSRAEIDLFLELKRSVCRSFTKEYGFLDIWTSSDDFLPVARHALNSKDLLGWQIRQDTLEKLCDV